MSSDTKDTATIEYVGFGFTLEEATKLMHQEVMRKDKKAKQKPSTTQALCLGYFT